MTRDSRREVGRHQFEVVSWRDVNYLKSSRRLHGKVGGEIRRSRESTI
jgi:hypothetical protein